MTRKNVFKRIYSVALELALVLAVSGAGFTLPQLFPGCSRVIPGGLCCLALVLPDHAGRRGFIDSRRRCIPDQLEVPGTGREHQENVR
jgi:hypothetical protein